MASSNAPVDTRQAISIVAHRILARAAAYPPVAPDWEDYPELGEHDWEQVVAEVQRLAHASDVTDDHFQAAYRHLAGRAEA